MTEIHSISADELAGRLAAGGPLTIVEALQEVDYRKAHLPNAINIPPNRIEELAPKLIPNKQAAVVVYCSSYDCGSSRKAAEKLVQLGYENVLEYEGGKKEWIESGRPTESGMPVQG